MNISNVPIPHRSVLAACAGMAAGVLSASALAAPADDLAWGPVTNGLQLGIRLGDNPGSMEDGKPRALVVYGTDDEKQGAAIERGLPTP